MKTLNIGSQMVFRNGLNDVVQIGKYKNQIVKWLYVIDKDPMYVEWLMNNVKSFDLDDEAKKYWRDIMLGKENG